MNLHPKILSKKNVEKRRKTAYTYGEISGYSQCLYATIFAAAKFTSPPRRHFTQRAYFGLFWYKHQLIPLILDAFKVDARTCR